MNEPNQGLRRHKLMPADVRRKLPALRSTDGKGHDAIAQLKIFGGGSFTLYVTEFDGDDQLYGYCVSASGDPQQNEWGYSSLRELAESTYATGTPMFERDQYWTPVPVLECEGYLEGVIA